MRRASATLPDPAVIGEKVSILAFPTVGHPVRFQHEFSGEQRTVTILNNAYGTYGISEVARRARRVDDMIGMTVVQVLSWV